MPDACAAQRCVSPFKPEKVATHMSESNFILKTKRKTEKPHITKNGVFRTQRPRKEHSFGGVVLGFEVETLRLVIDKKERNTEQRGDIYADLDAGEADTNICICIRSLVLATEKNRRTEEHGSQSI